MKPPISVLIVEDEALLACSLEMALRAMGYHVTGRALFGAEAVALIGRERPDVILMDITLGDEDGVALAAEIISSHAIPVVFLTGYSDTMTLSRIDKVPHSGVLLKPAEDFEIDQALRQAAEKA